MGTDRCEVESAPNRLILQLDRQIRQTVQCLTCFPTHQACYLYWYVQAIYITHLVCWMWDVGCGISNNRKEILHGEDLIEEGTLCYTISLASTYIYIY